jgi:hypothetical protein
MRIRLTRRLAESVDDVDLSHRRVGDFFDLSDRDGAMLIAEGWATKVETRGVRSTTDDKTARREPKRRT